MSFPAASDTPFPHSLSIHLHQCPPCEAKCLFLVCRQWCYWIDLFCSWEQSYWLLHYTTIMHVNEWEGWNWPSFFGFVNPREISCVRLGWEEELPWEAPYCYIQSVYSAGLAKVTLRFQDPDEWTHMLKHAVFGCFSCKQLGVMWTVALTCHDKKTNRKMTHTVGLTAFFE